MKNIRVMSPSEDSIQTAIANWLDAHDIFWFHVPNGGKRGAREAAKFKRLGVKAGIPDIIIITPPPLRPLLKGTAIELKKKGGKLSPKQRDQLKRFKSNMWYSAVCDNYEDAIDTLKRLGYDQVGRPW